MFDSIKVPAKLNVKILAHFRGVEGSTLHHYIADSERRGQTSRQAGKHVKRGKRATNSKRANSRVNFNEGLPGLCPFLMQH